MKFLNPGLTNLTIPATMFNQGNLQQKSHKTVGSSVEIAIGGAAIDNNKQSKD